MAGPLAVIGAVTGGINALSSLTGKKSGGSAAAAPIDYYEQYGAQAAAASSPLTAAMQGLSVLQGGLGGALGQQGAAISSAQLSVLKEAIEQAQTQTSAQAAEALGLVGASLDQQKALGEAKLATELTAPQFTSKAAEGALSGENAFAQLLGQTNMGLKALQESTKADVAADQAKALGDVFRTRALAEGQLALGAQKLESGLTLQRGQTLSNLQQIQGQTQAQMALRRQGNQLAMAGQRYFA
jgi:hypothetical protein